MGPQSLQDMDKMQLIERLFIKFRTLRFIYQLKPSSTKSIFIL